ncbi:MAG: hypothetical protein U5L04_04515 [Trueperaceae bacterium]|nr:hypothetical protein [Trueperaceae bacterium]
MRGFDPFGFVLLGSSVGFYDADGVTPLYRDALGDGSGAGGIGGLQGGVTIAPPEFPLFFNPPANSTLSELGIPLVTQRPEVRNVSFTAKSPAQGRNTPSRSRAGTFSYDALNAGAHNLPARDRSRRD